MIDFPKYIESCDIDDLKSVPLHSKKSIDIHSFQNDTISLTHYCAICNSLECYIYLTEIKKYPLNGSSANSLTPLHYAAQLGNSEIFQYILAKISQNEDYFRSFIADQLNKGTKEDSLFYCLTVGCDVQNYMALESYDINLGSKEYSEILMFLIDRVAFFQSVDCLTYLIKFHPINDASMGSDNRTPLIKAIIYFLNFDIIKILSTICPVDKFDDYKMSAFFYACLNDRKDVARYLLEKMNTIEHPTSYQSSALHYICTLGDPVVAEIAFSKFKGEIRLNVLNERHYYATRYLKVQKGNEENIKDIIRILVKNGYDVNSNHTLFDFLMFNKSVEICRFLIKECGADPNLPYQGTDQMFVNTTFKQEIATDIDFAKLRETL